MVCYARPASLLAAIVAVAWLVFGGPVSHFFSTAAVMVAVLIPLGHLLVRYVPRLVGIGPLILPISVQAGIYLIQVPFAAAIRGMQRGRLLFLQYALFTATSLTGLVVGAAAGKLTGAAWGLTTGAGVGFVVFVALYAWAVARVRSADGPDAPDAVPNSRNASPASK